MVSVTPIPSMHRCRGLHKLYMYMLTLHGTCSTTLKLTPTSSPLYLALTSPLPSLATKPLSTEPLTSSTRPAPSHSSQCTLRVTSLSLARAAEALAEASSSAIADDAASSDEDAKMGRQSRSNLERATSVKLEAAERSGPTASMPLGSLLLSSSLTPLTRMKTLLPPYMPCTTALPLLTPPTRELCRLITPTPSRSTQIKSSDTRALVPSLLWAITGMQPRSKV
mmetsp:Transcript_23657/g.51906  ORF Transcript_23657/g.51906 Transcript_23657/m.51906 type:complete len:224 (+) Transcript_23657:172-843(+)